MNTQDITRDFVLHSDNIGNNSTCEMACKEFTAAEVEAEVLKISEKDNREFSYNMIPMHFICKWL